MLEAEQINPTGDRMLVRPYTKPNRYGSIILPDPTLEDRSGTLWEFIKGGPKYADVLGTELNGGDIIQTSRPMSGVYITYNLWMIRASQVQVVHPWADMGDTDNV